MTASGLTGPGDLRSLCKVIGVSQDDFRQAKRESKYNYRQYTHIDRKNKKRRNLCYPPDDSVLYRVQAAVKSQLLARIPLCAEIRGYLPGQHNILVASEVCGALYQGTLDISKFHPSIADGHVAEALRKHGLPWAWANRIARLVTFRTRHDNPAGKRVVPQGAPTSSHIANIVLDSILRRGVLHFATRMGIRVCNYGDDIAFFGPSPTAVTRCVRHARAEIEQAGFHANAEKTVLCEHRGGKRRFIGCATGRMRPDYPREKYRFLRKELRGLLANLKGGRLAALSDEQINSLRQRVAYVGRLNRQKARRLLNLFYRICSQVRRICALTRGATPRISAA